MAFKSKTNDDGEEEEQMAMFSRKFKKFMKFNQTKRYQRKEFTKRETSKKEKDLIIYFECKKSCHKRMGHPNKRRR
ncbi:hypothetical protein J1N35_005490 [Gossypium stocksii]|uniref:Uncharacterized protein n=1 Tax=Gossypium stocksii TaxID=47602 RepID=A0A9D4AJB4_9ROSI|nr:hypothetical protein J1N35_005490 [Gossypium stocksii]